MSTWNDSTLHDGRYNSLFSTHHPHHVLFGRKKDAMDPLASFLVGRFVGVTVLRFFLTGPKKEATDGVSAMGATAAEPRNLVDPMSGVTACQANRPAVIR